MAIEVGQLNHLALQRRQICQSGADGACLEGGLDQVVGLVDGDDADRLFAGIAIVSYRSGNGSRTWSMATRWTTMKIRPRLLPLRRSNRADWRQMVRYASWTAYSARSLSRKTRSESPKARGAVSS